MVPLLALTVAWLLLPPALAQAPPENETVEVPGLAPEESAQPPQGTFGGGVLLLMAAIIAIVGILARRFGGPRRRPKK